MCVQSFQRLQEELTKAAKKSKPRKPATSGGSSSSSSSSHEQTSDGHNSGDASSSIGSPHFVCPYLRRLMSYLAAREQGRAAGATHLRRSMLSPAVPSWWQMQQHTAMAGAAAATAAASAAAAQATAGACLP
jgi:hypothetical protein